MAEMTNEDLVKKVRELRELTGHGMMDCKKALVLFNGHIKRAYKFLEMRGQAVCRKRPDGRVWEVQDYVDYVNEEISETE